MRTKMFFASCVVAIVAGLTLWPFLSQSRRGSERKNPPPVKYASPAVITEQVGIAKLPGKTEEPDFVVEEAFKSRGGRPWMPLTGSLNLRPDAQEGLQLTSAEFQALKEAIAFLLSKSGEIQAEDAYVASDAEGNPLVFLDGIPAKWAGFKSTFNEMLESAIGGPKSKFLLSSNAQELGMVTGNFGNDGRAMIFQRADVATPGDMGGWRVSIIANREIEQAIGRFFPPDTQKKIRRASQSMGSGWELTVDFVEPPPFIKPLIELEGEK